jgi:hypothetical protein
MKSKKKGKGNRRKAKPPSNGVNKDVVVDDGKSQPTSPSSSAVTEEHSLLMEYIYSMKTSNIKKELESRKISTESFIEKSELVDALVKARVREAKEASQRSSTMSGLLSDLTLGRTAETNKYCSHGVPSLSHLTYRVSKFVNMFETKMKHVMQNMISTHNQPDEPLRMDQNAKWKEIMDLVPRNLHPYYQNKIECSNIMAHLISLGTNYVLEENGPWQLYNGFIAQTVLYIEVMSTKEERGETIANCMDYDLKLRDIWEGQEMETTSFFHKRNGCNCLKEKYTQMKAKTKLGCCHGCNGYYERRKMMLCDQCKHAQYCSKDCQRLHWPNHKQWCKLRNVDFTSIDAHDYKKAGEQSGLKIDEILF